MPYTAGGDKALGVAFAEQQLMAAILRNPADTLPMAEAAVQPQQLISPEMAEAYTLLLQMGAAGEYIDLATAGAALPQKTTALLSRALALNHDTGFSREDVQMYIDRITEGHAAGANVAEMDAEEYKAWMAEKRRRKLGAAPEADP